MHDRSVSAVLYGVYLSNSDKGCWVFRNDGERIWPSDSRTQREIDHQQQAAKATHLTRVNRLSLPGCVAV